MTDEHSSFIKTPKQLVVVVVLAFAIPIALIVLLSQLITGIRPVATEDTEAGVLNRIKPVGEVTIGEANIPKDGEVARGQATAPKADKTGEQVYQTVCKACHEAGVSGAPKFGDNAAWAAPLDMASGTAMMQKHGCAACHAVDKKIVGPAYQDVAAKYKDDKDAASKLVQKVKTGGSGVWGQVPMPPNAAVPEEDVKALVAW